MPDEPRVFLSSRARAAVENFKNGVERRPLRFSTICARNLGLNLNIDKVTVVLRRPR